MSAGSSSVVLKRLAFLNRSGALVRPLQYSQVKSCLDGLGEELALGVLEQLEEAAASVPDPVEFVKATAAEQAAAGPPAAGRPAKRKAPGGGAGPREGGAEDGIVAKRVRLLNGSGQLAQPIAYGRVRDALGSLGVAQAMTILKGLEDVAGEVSDPTVYIRTAVRGAGGSVLDEPFEDGEGEEQEAAQEQEGGEDPAEAAGQTQLGGVKGAVGGQAGRGQGDVKMEGRHWPKNEELTDAEKVDRRVAWLNRNGGLPQPLDFDEVLPALDCIGLRQAMRVLRRLEESAASASDPNEFVKDLVARSGWIWSKPDIIDDDEKVAKRVAWLNLFGGLQQPIDYAQVADVLDGLKVPHAMVLLRELEVQAHSIANPTEHIRQAVGLAGEDEVHVPVVDEDSSAAQLVAQLNQAGRLAAPIDFAEVGEDLARIGDEHALQLLQEVESKGPGVKDPTGYLKFKLKAKLASLGTALEESADDETRILKRIEWLNDYGGLMQDIDYDRVAAALQGVGVEHAMTVLKELEDKRSTVRDPNAFLLASVGSTHGARGVARPGAGPQAGRGARRPPAAMAAKGAAAGGAGRGAGAAGDLATLTGFVGFLNKSSRLKRPVKFSEVAHALDSLGPKRAARVLQEMQERGLGLDDPVAYIKAAAQRSSRAAPAGAGAEEGDDVARITKRLNWLNQFGGLGRKIRADDVIGALYCLGLPQSMAILRGLQEKGARVMDPTGYIKASIQRANGLRSAPQEDEEEEEEADGLGGEEAQEEEEGPGEEGGEEQEEDVEDGAIEEFAEPEGDEEMDEIGVEGEEADAGADAGDGFDEIEVPVEEDYPAEEVPPAKQAPAAVKPKPSTGERRVVGGLTGYNKLIPKRPTYAGAAPEAGTSGVKSELFEDAEAKPDDEKPAEAPAAPAPPARPSFLPLTPQEKLVQIRDLATKHGLDLDQNCLKALSRLPYHRAKDLIDDVLLGGRNRTGVSNPSRYLTVGIQKLANALGVEQGIAMELAVSFGVVLNNDALDELASIPRREAHAIIREVARNPESRQDPLSFIAAEVMRCRAQLDARPWPPAA